MGPAPLIPADDPDGHPLLEWWDGQRRELPWRETRDPWAVLVCEVMAQQTQVARVAVRWPVFMERFPTPTACAAAPTSEVIRLWAGLGYNRRAVHLHRCATALVEHHGGELPRRLDELLALPGVGPYTARAVAAFAFELDAGIVDTNTARVLARWEGRRLTPRQAQAAADAAVPTGRAWAWNQAMLDLGALVCRRRAPACERCPETTRCGWFSAGRPDPDPADGSAGVGRAQPPFSGSDREARGRLVAVLRTRSVEAGELGAVMGCPQDPDRAEQLAASVIRDGVAVRLGATLHLAGEPAGPPL